MGDRPTEETLANVSAPARPTLGTLRAALVAEHARDRYDIGLPGVDEPVTIRLRAPRREEHRNVYMDDADRCQLVARSVAGEEIHAEHIHFVFTDTGSGLVLTLAVVSGHPIGVPSRTAIRYYPSRQEMPAWLVAMAEYVSP